MTEPMLPEELKSYIDPRHMVCVAMNCYSPSNGKFDADNFIFAMNKRDTAIRQSERAKQKEIENELDEATNLLIESNNLLKQHLPTIKNYEDQIIGLLNLLAEIESSGYLKEKITYNETELEGRVRSALTKFNNEEM